LLLHIKNSKIPPSMKTVKTTFSLTYTDEQYKRSLEFVEDMKKHPKRVYWIGKEGKSDEELVISHIAHRILSGFYNNYNPNYTSSQILAMESAKNGSNNN